MPSAKHPVKPKGAWDLIIIGGGPGGLSAAIYAARFRLKTLVIAKELGGQVAYTHVIENYPGLGSVSGMECVQKFVEHAKMYKVPIKEEEALDVSKSGDLFSVRTNAATYSARTLLFATGTERRKLGVPGESRLTSKGVSYCAVCDGPLFRDKVVGVVGGSDAAAKEALFLARYAKKVYIIYRREKIRSEPVTTAQVEKEKKIEIIPNSVVAEIRGKDFVESAVLEDVNTKKRSELALEGLFIEIGGVPGSALAKRLGVALNERGEIVVDRGSQTNVPGVLAAGDVTDSEYKQVITAAAQGVVAAYSAYKFVKQAAVA
ncbi:MAG: FAD-dependent oxidoreductase [Candidatus Aenigmatarchaeota archaeon]